MMDRRFFFTTTSKTWAPAWVARNLSESRQPYLVHSGATLEHLENPVEADEGAGSLIVKDGAFEGEDWVDGPPLTNGGEGVMVAVSV